MERLTDEQIKATVATLRMAEAEKARLLERALAGQAAARFVVYAASRRPSACR
jgi:hypothetical protein